MPHPRIGRFSAGALTVVLLSIAGIAPLDGFGVACLAGILHEVGQGLDRPVASLGWLFLGAFVGLLIACA